MVNLTGKEVRQGLASYDEMCDVYMMYWANPGDDQDQVKTKIQMHAFKTTNIKTLACGHGTADIRLNVHVW
jgi:hypothetical protein